MRTLATLAQVKEWLGIPSDNTDADQLLTRLLGSATAFIYSAIQRETFAKRQFNEVYDGYGQTWMVLRQDPILSVQAVSANGIPYTKAGGDGITVPYSGGFALLQDRVTLFGRCFPRQRSSVFVSYSAGYYVDGEAAVVPAVAPYQLSSSLHWLEDGGVVTAGGVALTAVAVVDDDNQYSVSDGLYTISDNLAEQTVLLSYSYVPDDVVQAVIEMVGERFKYRDRIGYSSKSLGGQETVAFSANRVSDHIRELINRYKRVVPV